MPEPFDVAYDIVKGYRKVTDNETDVRIGILSIRESVLACRIAEAIEQAVKHALARTASTSVAPEMVNAISPQAGMIGMRGVYAPR